MNEKFCNRCGTPLDEKSKVCPLCSYDLGKRNLPPTIYKIVAALLVTVLVLGILLTMQRVNRLMPNISAAFNYQMFESAKGFDLNERSKR